MPELRLIVTFAFAQDFQYLIEAETSNFLALREFFKGAQKSS
jgi:hypothetical protein